MRLPPIPTKRAMGIARLPRRADAFQIPRPIGAGNGLFVVDATWGRINPIQLADGVRTVGELEVIAHIERGLPLVDARLPHHFAAGSIPTAVNIPHTETTARIDELDPDVETVIF